MDIKKIFDSIIRIDKKIFRIYEGMVINDLKEKSNTRKINQLKNLLELETWAYDNLHLDYDKLTAILNEFESYDIPDTEEAISKKILLSRIKKTASETLDYKVEKKFVEQLVLCRIYNYLRNLSYLDEKTPKEVNGYVEEDCFISKKDDETDVYITDDSYLTMRRLNQTQYVKHAINHHKYVLAFNTACKKRLELEAETDIEQMEIMLLEIKTGLTKIYQYYYFSEIYEKIFNNKLLEQRVLRADFMFDNLFQQFSTQANLLEANRKFLEVYRSQQSYLVIKNHIHRLFNFEDVDFSKGYLATHYNSISFHIWIEFLNARVSVMRSDELKEIQEICLEYYEDEIKENQCAKIVYSCLDPSNGKNLRAIIDDGLTRKVKCKSS